MEQDFQLLEVKVIGCFWPYYLWNARYDYLSHLSLSRHLVFTLRAVDWSSLLGSVYYCFLANSIGFAVVAGGVCFTCSWVCFGLVSVSILFFISYFLFASWNPSKSHLLLDTYIYHTYNLNSQPLCIRNPEKTTQKKPLEKR